ncbi:MAG: hypothetical protein ABFD50_11825 [Smithella sp.]
MVRLVFLFLLILLVNLSGCNSICRNYVNHINKSAIEVEKTRAIHGSINVILLPGYEKKSDNQDTLLSCLKLSQDINPESVKLPPNEELYLAHVAEFILRSLKHYQLQENFEDFYGCRIIMKFRKLTPHEVHSKKLADHFNLAVGTAGMIASFITSVPLNAILFTVDGVKMEIDRQKIEDHAIKTGLPQPKKSIIITKLEEEGRTLLHIKDEIGQELTGKTNARIQFDQKISSYLIEECILERATMKQISLYQEQIQRFKNFN